MTAQAADPTEAELREARRARVFAAMDATDLDVLVLGRRDDVAYASGARSLWTAGTRPFGAACVLVAARRATHLLSTWDAGVPPEIEFEHLYGLTWNPARMAEAMRAIPGLTEARRIGVDALSPGFRRAVRRLAPDARLVAAHDVIRAVRAVKLPAEVVGIRAAVAVCAAAVDAVAEALAEGVPVASARAAAVRAAARHGVTVPSSGIAVERVAPIGAGQPDLVHIDVGLLVDGYEGGHGRTLAVASGDDQAVLGADVDAALHRLLAACRAGATGRDVRAAAAGSDRWLVRGSGMGFEEPVVTADLGPHALLRAGMVLSVEAEAGPWRRRDVVLVGDGRPATVL